LNKILYGQKNQNKGKQMPEIQLGGQPLISQTGTGPPQLESAVALPAEAALPSIVLTPTDTAPTATEVAIYYDSTSNVIKVHDGTSWDNIIPGTSSTNWNTAYGWGDHSTAGYLTSETDPVFSAHDASNVTSSKITNWDTAHGWGDHSLAGYLTSETDPVFSAHDASNVTSSKITNWDTAHGWGDHSTAGYGSPGGAGIPAGMIGPFAMGNAPGGWLICDGSRVSTTTYAALVTAIYVGDGSNASTSIEWGQKWDAATGGSRSTSGTYLSLPDLRGAFLRGTGTSLVDANYVGPAVGSSQSDQITLHEHTFWNFSGGLGGGQPSTVGGGTSPSASAWPTTHGGQTGNTGGEVRVYNYGIQFCIKY